MYAFTASLGTYIIVVSAIPMPPWPHEGGVVAKQVMLVRLIQPQNAPFAMLVTLLGISILVRPEQPSNAEKHIVVVPSFMAIEVFAGIVPLYL